jgi:hypothetical protein
MQGNSAIYNFPISLKRQLVSIHEFTLKKFIFLSFCFISLLFAFYIFQVNEYTRAGFAVSEYQGRIAEISKENKQMEISFSKTYTLASLESLLGMMDYEEVERIQYVRMAGSQVATNSR